MKEAINTFTGGLDTNTIPKILDSSKYLYAENIEVAADGQLGSVSQMRGTKKSVGNLPTPINGSTYMCGGTYSKVKTDEGLQDGIVVFAYQTQGEIGQPLAGELTFSVYACVLETPSSDPSKDDVIEQFKDAYKDARYKKLLYRQSLGKYSDALYSTAFKAQVIATDFLESNIPVVYFTDRNTPLKKIPVDISSTTQAPYTTSEIIAAPTGMPSPPKVFVREYDSEDDSFPNGERVLCGTYFVSVRLFNSKTRNYTKWSLLNGPIAVSRKREYTSGSFVNEGKIGPSDKQLLLRLDASGLSSSELSSYDRVQYAVIEKTDGDGTPTGLAKITEPIEFDFNFGEEPTTISYSNSSYENIVDVNEITVDDAQVVACNSFTIKNGRVIQGGLKYADLEYKKKITVDEASYVEHRFGNKEGSLDFFNEENEVDQERRNGYFRDEVYRFGIVYHDEYGNWGPVQALDLSAGNSASADGCIDFKFPSMQKSPLIKTKSSIGMGRVSLGLKLKGIRNHPSWARGFAIVRAKRRKNIMFQTPMIATRWVSSPYASQVYPQSGFPTPNEDAQIGNVLGSMFPKDLSNLTPWDFVHESYDYNGTATQFAKRYMGTTLSPFQEDISYQSPTDANRRISSGAGAGRYIYQVFNPNNLYSFNNTTFEPYQYQNGDKIRARNTVYLKANFKNASTYSSPYLKVSDPESTSSFSWYQNPLHSYYYDGNNRDDYSEESISIFRSKLLPTSNKGIGLNNILEYQDIALGQEKVTLINPPSNLESASYGDHSGVQSTLEEGYRGNNQPSSLIVTENPWVDASLAFLNQSTFLLNGVSIPATARGSLIEEGVNTSSFDSVDAYTIGNLFPYSSAYQARGSVSRDGNVVHIANVERGLNDFRYGDSDSFHEFVFCGKSAYVGFNSKGGDKTLYDVTVFGGDCYVSKHTFKSQDTGFAPAGRYNDPLRTIALVGFSNENAESGTARLYGTSFLIPNLSIGGVGLEFNRAIPYKARPQTISVFLESEVDSTFYLTGEHTDYTKVSLDRRTNLCVPRPVGIGQSRTPFTYEYNLGYSLPNNFKIFVPKLKDVENVTDYPARLIFSDPVIYNSRDNGTGRFRVANTLDLNEVNGSISSINLLKDRLMVFQDRGISYVPTSSNVLEQTDTDTISIRTDEFLSTPIVLSVDNGCSHPRTIAGDGDGLYYMDKFNKTISYLKADGSITNISDTGLKNFFNQRLSDADIVDHEQVGAFDFINDRYIYLSGAGVDLELGSGYPTFGVVYSKDMGAWETFIYTGGVSDSRTYNGKSRISSVYTPSGLYFLADNSFYQYCITTTSSFCGVQGRPSIAFGLNPDVTDAKTFDVLNINANTKPLAVSVSEKLVNQEEFPNQIDGSVAAVMPSDDIYEREKSYRVPVKRISTGRVRGQIAYAKISLSPLLYVREDNQSSKTIDNRLGMVSAITMYRKSERAR